MANTYSQTGQILQVDGENANTWGDFTNENWDINAFLVGGITTLDFTGEPTQTITSVNGTADQGKNRTFLLQGTLGSASTLTFPAVQREYVIINQCTGAFTMTVLPTGGTGVVIPQSVGGVMVYCDGTNMHQSIDLTALGGVNPANPNVYTGQQNFGTYVLTYGSTISWNLNVAQFAQVTLAGNAILENPSNMVDGGTYVLRVVQGASGSNILTYGDQFDFGSNVAPVLSTTVGLKDYLTFFSDGTSMDFVGIQLGF